MTTTARRSAAKSTTLFDLGALIAVLLCGACLGALAAFTWLGPDGNALVEKRCNAAGDPIACLIAITPADFGAR